MFNVQIGRVVRVSLAYGPQGQSKGVATVQFQRKGDAKKAYDAYNGKLIDNTKRLKVLSPSHTTPSSTLQPSRFFVLPMGLTVFQVEIVMDPRYTKAPLANRIERPAVAAVM